MHLSSIDFKALRKLRLNGATESEKPRFDNPLVMKKINIFIGANGGGKSTIIDLVRSISNPMLLPTLPRENMRNYTLSGFVLKFEGGTALAGVINKTDLKKYGMNLALYAGGSSFEYKGVFGDKISGSEISKIKDVYKLIPATVAYRNAHNEKGMKLSDIVATINDERLFLDGLLSSPLEDNQFRYNGPPELDRNFAENNPVQVETEKESLLSIWFNDDRSQSNRVRLDMLPSGWRAFCGLLTWLKKQPDGYICTIEEPETHIHPQLLRKMISRIVKISEEKNLQLFITTHSSVLMDVNLWGSDDIELFEVGNYDVNVLTDPFRILSRLGVRPSDINHANGIIWVEGPSDRVYILHWLDLLCKHNGYKTFRENYHFSILVYGGSILNHLSANDKDNKINIFKVNKNSLVVIDKDLDFEMVNDEWCPINTTHSKNRIRKTVCSVITEGYTIESFLPNYFFDDYFDVSNEKVIKRSSLSKVDIAKRYCNSYNSLSDCFGDISGIGFIQFIYNEIEKWNI